MAEDEQDPWKVWRGRISASEKRRDERVGIWQNNVNARKGLVRAWDGSSSLRTWAATTVTVNQDWSLTKAKIAQLYSQTPEVRLTPRSPQFQQAVPIFSRELNDTIRDAGVGSTIEEVLTDVVNASGIGAVLVSCETRTAPKEVPTVDPALVPPELHAQIPTTTVEAPTDRRYLAQRISPADLLVPDDFTGSNYKQSRWLGEQGRMTWVQGQRNLHLKDEDKEKVLGRDTRASGSTQSLNTETNAFRDTDVVTYTQIFYWRHYYHADETNFTAIQRLVFVDGLDEPVINEPYTGQKRGADGRMLGVTTLPIIVATLTYISDDCLPPSDSTISRGQVDELSQSRDAMLQHRKHSVPIRWFDTNRVSGATRSLLEKGTFQGFIPTNGPGERAVGEVSRASLGNDRYEWDSLIKNEITEIWQVGTNQAGAFATGERSASEAKIVQQNFQTRVGQERDKATRLFLGIAEVLAGHLALYGTFDVPDELGVAREALATGFTYSVRADSTVRMDAQQRIEQLKDVLNLTAQSGFINPGPIISEIVELSGIDPTKVMIQPQPKPPEPVKVSVSKAEDVINPIFLALLMRTHQGPLPEDVAAAQKLLASVGIPAVALPPMAAQPPANGNGSGLPTEVARPEMAHSGWDAAPRLDQRQEDGGA